MTVSRSFLFLEFIVLSWWIGRVISIAQLVSRLGAARRRFDSRPLPLLSFLLLVLSFFLLLQKKKRTILFHVKIPLIVAAALFSFLRVSLLFFFSLSTVSGHGEC